MACRGSGVRVPVAPPTATRPPIPHPSPARRGVNRLRGTRDRDHRDEPTDDPRPDRALRPDRRSSRAGRRAGPSSGCIGRTSTTRRGAKFYLLTMYPYPSGDIHIGHWYIMTPTDAIARFHRMHGENVFLPIGFDAFGLPAENAAIKNNINPRDWTMSNIDNMRRQLRTMGATFDWEAEVVTADPDYYRWNQWFFLQFLKAGLAYRQTSPVDWCPNDGTLAREQVEGVDRHCWRCGAKVEKRDLAQWYLKVTNYADELLDFSGLAVAGADQDPADELDRAERGRRDRLRHRPVRAPRGRRRAARLHDPPGHAVRGDVHGPRPRAPARRGADGARIGRRRSTRTSPRPRSGPRSIACRPIARRPASRSGPTRSTRSTASGSRSSSPTTSSAATGPARSWPSRPTTSATTRSRSSTACRSGVSSRRACEDADATDGRGVHRRTPAARSSSTAGRTRGLPADEGGTAILARAGSPRQGQGRGHLPPARLADQPPALLGHADPGHLLRARRDRARARGGPARSACRTPSTTAAAARTRWPATRRS